MEWNGLISTFPIPFKRLILVFVLVLGSGFLSGMLFVGETTSGNPKGITEQYLGNEDDENAEVMKFKKSEKEMLTLIHNHVLSMSIIFFLLGVLLGTCKLKSSWKSFLMLEPFISIVLTFGGLYGLWKGLLWMKYLVMLSGTVMVLVFISSSIIIISQVLKK